MQLDEQPYMLRKWLLAQDIYMSKLVATSKGKLRNNQQVDAEIYPEVHFPMEANLRWSGAVFTKVKHRVALIWHTVSPLCLTTDVARHLSLCCRWGWQLEPLQGWSTLHKLEGLHQMHRAAKTWCSKAGAHTTTQLVAPGNVFVATKAPRPTRLSHTPQPNWRLPTNPVSHQDSEISTTV